MAAPLQYLVNTLKVGALEKVSFSNGQNPKTVCNPLTADDKYYLLNRDNLAQPIEMQIFQKEKNISQIFFLHC